MRELSEINQLRKDALRAATLYLDAHGPEAARRLMQSTGYNTLANLIANATDDELRAFIERAK